MFEVSIQTFLAELSSSAPAPGGGASSALVGALACAQARMVCEVARTRKAYRDDESLKALSAFFAESQETFLVRAQEDECAYNAVARALKLPKETSEERASRSHQLQKALIMAAEVPTSVLTLCASVLLKLAELLEHPAMKVAPSDIVCAAAFLTGTAEGAHATVRANTHWMHASDEKIQIAEDARAQLAQVQELARTIIEVSNEELA